MTHPPREDSAYDSESEIILRYVQRGLVGLIDGTLSSLAPVLSAALLSDNGTHTGRGSGTVRGVVTGTMTLLGGVLHTLPFLIPDRATALSLAGFLIAAELLCIAFLRQHLVMLSSVIVNLGTAWNARMRRSSRCSR